MSIRVRVKSPKGSLKMKFSLLGSMLALLMSAGILAVHAENNMYPPPQTKPPDRCSVIPKEDNCKANFHIYYFDTQAGKCGELWGCYGDVFSSMEECRKHCEKSDGTGAAETSPSEALLLYLNQGNGDPEIIKGFIGYGADLNFRDEEYHMTPLHNASHYGQFDAVMLLLEHGADVNAKNIEGNNPLFAAVHQQHLEISRVLIERGADINARNKFGYTPIRTASRMGNTEILKLLIGKGADVNVKDNKGDTPLHFAVDGGSTVTVQILITHGADINAVGSHGGSPVHIAVAFRFNDILKMLVEKGADLNARDRRGNTPLDLAEQRGYAETIEILNNYKGNKI